MYKVIAGYGTNKETSQSWRDQPHIHIQLQATTFRLSNKLFVRLRLRPWLLLPHFRKQ
jgi:hypothetical protein